MLRNRYRPLALIATLALASTLGACGDDPLSPRYPEDVNFDPSLGIDLAQMTQLESGVYIQTIQEGTGLPVTTGTITMAYTLWLPDGSEVDSSDNFEITYGQTSLIPGFLIGISGMRVGEIRKIVIPSELGYGARGSGSVPPHSVLIFEVELLTGNTPD